LIDFVIGLLQGLAFVFVVYGAYLAIGRTGVRPNLGEPPLASADSEKMLLLEGGVEPSRERRLSARRKADRRTALRQGLYGLPM
jgi:hypothetical protein